MDTHDRSLCRRFGQTDRRRLERALAEARDARLYRRVQALLALAEGEPVAQVARRARAQRSTVHRWVERYLASRRAEDLCDRKRSGRPRAAPELSRAALARALATDPRTCGYDASTWTVALLATHLGAQGVALSARTLRRRIRAARFRWKRPRYVYSERAEHVGAKKGGSSGA